jgi:hypothetical protein
LADAFSSQKSRYRIPGVEAGLTFESSWLVARQGPVYFVKYLFYFIFVLSFPQQHADKSTKTQTRTTKKSKERKERKKMEREILREVPEALPEVLLSIVFRYCVPRGTLLDSFSFEFAPGALVVDRSFLYVLGNDACVHKVAKTKRTETETERCKSKLEEVQADFGGGIAVDKQHIFVTYLYSSKKQTEKENENENKNKYTNDIAVLNKTDCGLVRFLGFSSSLSASSSITGLAVDDEKIYLSTFSSWCILVLSKHSGQLLDTFPVYAEWKSGSGHDKKIQRWEPRALTVDAQHLWLVAGLGFDRSVHKLDKITGRIVWSHQDIKHASGISICGQFVFVSDGFGGVHVLQKRDGAFVTKFKAAGHGSMRMSQIAVETNYFSDFNVWLASDTHMKLESFSC